MKRLMFCVFCLSCGLTLSGCMSVPESMRGGRPMAVMALDQGAAIEVSPFASSWVGQHPYLTTVGALGAGFGGYHLCRKQGWLGLGDRSTVSDSGNSSTSSSTVTISGNNGSTIIVNQAAPDSMNETKP